MSDTFSPAALKKRRNAKGLQLSSQSLAPPTSSAGGGNGNGSATGSQHLLGLNHAGAGHGGMIQDALSEYINMNQATPTIASASASATRKEAADNEDDEEKVMTPTQANLAPALPHPIRSTTGKSRVSRKKPIDLDISKSLAVRKAPLHPGGGSDELGERLEGMRVGDGNISSSSSTARPTTTRRPSTLSHAETSTSSATSSSRPSTKKKKPTSSSGPKEKETLEVGPFGDLRNDEFKVVGDLGAGAGGTVDKVIHVPTGTIMAKKVGSPSPFPNPQLRANPNVFFCSRALPLPQLVLIDAKPAVRKQILRELQIMHGCASPFIVSFYGAFMKEPHICICMEYMDRT
ncbi:hypothetical protein QFC22_001515 [Naganishia vaughanmartiniae]|uniref:Uncharacterized protein n=1 Tax=Naganishia vaughanmartiniae TaxID=1424756 RepID=A0ACC2XIU3_9TREE|nr:hypothetical protein QFC22_001515 [Naganishia vaughanmartiniae]